MAAITAELVKQLREISGAGMMDCKKALTENDGNIDASMEWLRKKGIASAAKKSDRIASEGAVSLKVADDFTSATLVEINSETDFVAKNDKFQKFASDTIGHIHCESASDVESLNTTTINGTTFEEYLKTQISQIGENIVVRRFAKLSAGENGCVSGYVHSNGKVGVVVAGLADKAVDNAKFADLLKDLGMQAAAMKPQYLNETLIPQEIVDKEIEIAKAQLAKEGKPEAMWDKIIPGKVKKFAADVTLMGQLFVKDDKKTVAQVVEAAGKELGAKIEIVDFVRFELGEGIEKKGCDFASEVAAQLA